MEPHSFCGTGYVIVTTYETFRQNADVYVQHSWSYVVLDEAQKSRNPDADVTLAFKQLRRPHRLALSGTPVLDSLRERESYGLPLTLSFLVDLARFQRSSRNSPIPSAEAGIPMLHECKSNLRIGAPLSCVI